MDIEVNQSIIFGKLPYARDARGAIVAFYDDFSLDYVGMFRFCAALAYPEYDVMTIYVKNCAPGIIPSLRFLYEDCFFINYDFILITDIDILIMRESPTIEDQHFSSMERHNLIGYDNYVVEDRMIGVHFVNRLWWPATSRWRCHEMLRLMSMGTPPKGYDEEMLFRIVKNSDLPWQKSEMNLWSEHGIHLGAYRTNEKTPLFGQKSSFYQELMKNTDFVNIMSDSSLQNKTIDTIFKNIRSNVQ